MKILKKIMVAIFSSAFLSLSLAFLMYTPIAEQQPGVSYFSFGSLLIGYLLYSLPVYLIVGGLYSAFVDVYIDSIQFRNKHIKYIVGFFIYGVGGLLIMGLILLLDRSNELETLKTSALGLLAGLIFFHISLIWNRASVFFSK